MCRPFAGWAGGAAGLIAWLWGDHGRSLDEIGRMTATQVAVIACHARDEDGKLIQPDGQPDPDPVPHRDQCRRYLWRLGLTDVRLLDRYLAGDIR